MLWFEEIKFPKNLSIYKKNSNVKTFQEMRKKKPVISRW